MTRHFRRLSTVTLLCAMSGHAVNAAELPVWGYYGETGPNHWGELDPDFATCAKGQAQSPINIGLSQVTQMRPPQFRYKASKLELVNQGRGVIAKVEPGSWLHIDGKKYELKHFEFRTPSEHKVRGRELAMELQFVHQNPQGETAIVGVLARVTFRPHAVLKRIWAHLPSEPGKSSDMGGMRLNLISLLPMKHDFVTYQGSLTHPPCSEGVRWLVMQTPIRVSKKQVDTFTRLIGNNARPVQALNGRKLLKRR